MDPKTRKLIRVTIDEDEPGETTDLVERLMGKKPECVSSTFRKCAFRRRIGRLGSQHAPLCGDHVFGGDRIPILAALNAALGRFILSPIVAAAILFTIAGLVTWALAFATGLNP